MSADGPQRIAVPDAPPRADALGMGQGSLAHRAPRSGQNVTTGTATANGNHAVERFRSVPPNDRYEPFALSELQRAYLAGRDPAIPLGGIGCHLYLEFERRDLDPVRLERTWNMLIRRHEALRIIIEGNEHQRILPDVPWVTIPVTRMADATLEDAEAAVAAIRNEMTHFVHDVSRWPLHDLRLCLLPGGMSRVCAGFDLIGIDAASVIKIFSEFRFSYDEACVEQPAVPAVGYREHRIADENRRGGEKWTRDRDYWRGILPSLPGAPQLPYAARFEDLTPPEVRRHRRMIDPAIMDQLAERASVHRLSPPKVLNAVFAEIIAAYSSERHFLLNLPIMSKPDTAKSEGTLGNYTFNVLLSADMRAGTFAERASGLWRNFARALRHRSYSGVNVAQDIQRLRGGPLQPIAPIVLTNLYAHREHSAQDYIWEPVVGITRTPQVTLDHQIGLIGDRLTFDWDTVVGAFPPGLIEEMAEAQIRLLRTLAEDESAWTDPCLSVLDTAQQNVRERVNATARALEHGLLHDGFFANARSHPDRAALIEGDRIVSFAELAALAEGVRHVLGEAGVEQGEAVACALPHGISLAAAALGILAHDAVYCPLDPASPAPRRQREIAVLQPRVALIDSSSRESFSAAALRTIDVAAIAPATGAVPALARRAQPDDRAYVIFTSGTTGDPKAIAITHRGAMNTCTDLIARFAIGQKDRTLGLSAPTFDLSIFDLFALWTAGGCCVLPPASGKLDPAAWIDSMRVHGVTVWNTVPALMTMLVAQAESRGIELDGVRLVMLSGDWVPPALVPRVARLSPTAQILALGGATEASIWSIAHSVAPEDASLPSIPYGIPLANQTIHVLDETLAQRPAHVEGDIFIGGVGLAECYLGDPVRTAAAFIKHPKTGERLYLTGDRGRYRPDGVVEFLGRRDTQLKLQGFRIEAGEVEAALRSAGGVDEVVVDVLGDRFETKRLVAFVVPSLRLAPSDSAPTSKRTGSRPLDSQALRASLRDKAAAGAPQRIKRRSAKGFAAEPATWSDLAGILSVLCHREEDGEVRSVYPSGGGIYPVQVYLYVEPGRVHDLDGGLYYVDPDGALVTLSNAVIETAALHVAHNRSLAAQAAFTLLLFGHMPAVTPTYGPLARDLCLLEAGYIGQALMTAAAETGCELCPIGAMVFAPLVVAAKLHPEDQFLHAFVGGVRTQRASLTVDFEDKKAALAPADFVAMLRAHASAQLQPYMVPSDFVLIEELPLSANGKVDRAPLRALANAKAREAEVPSEPPSDDLEQRLSELARHVLALDAIDVNREFFAMGADSVKLVEFAAVIEKEFGHRFQVVDAFAHPTIRKMARHLATLGASPGARNPLVSAANRRAASRRLIRQRPQDPGRS